MFVVHCCSPCQLDAIWRMLSHVPDDDFVPVEVYLDGVFRYRIIRSDGEQTTVQPGDPLASTNPDP